MLKEIESKLAVEAKTHRSNLNSFLESHKLEQNQVTKDFMTGDWVKLPPEVLREVFYLDAFAKVSNLINFRAKDSEYWDIRDFVVHLIDEVADWYEAQPNLLKWIKESKQLESFELPDDSSLFPFIVLAAIKRHEQTKHSNDEGDGPEAA